MSQVYHCAAIDLGATSGRVIVGTYNGESLELTEVHRFPNAFHRLNKNDYWDIGGLFTHIREGLKKAKAQFPELVSCGVDTWGVDYALLDKSGRLLFPVHAYRDARTEPILKRIEDSGNAEELYSWTGNSMINYNSGLQLAETIEAFPFAKEAVDRALFLPDYFNFLLSGTAVNEFSIASTAQLLDLHGERFHPEALKYFNIPEHWLKGPEKAGRKLGKVRDIEGLESVDVILVPGHDTSCAYEAIPKIGNDFILSAGTWLLAGATTEKPASGNEALKSGITNERCGNGDYRPCRILLGLWLLEQVMPYLEGRPQTAGDWANLVSAAEAEAAPATLIDTSDKTLFNPPNMQAAIEANLKRQGGTAPASLPGYMRLICESLGESVKDAIAGFSRLTGSSFDNIVVVGGGSKNQLLCQRIADHSGLPVTSLELEGTTVGNIGYQLLGLGAIDHLDTFRAAVAKTLKRQTYMPKG